MGALSLAEAVVEVLADTSKLKPSLEAGAKKAFTSYEKAAANSGKVAGGDLSWATGRAALAGAGKPFTDFATGASKIAGKALIGGFAVAGTAAAAGIGVALTKGMGRLTSIDNAQAKLRGLGNDTKAVEGIMQNALAAVKGTAFGLDEAATLSASLVASGIEPGKNLESTLRLVADAATVAGTDMSSMGNIFGKVAATGKLQGDEMNQLMENGIPILQLLTEHYGKNANEVRKMVSEGKVQFADFAAAMQNQVGGAALESGKTFSGAMANLKASLGRIGANILQPIFEQLAPLASEVTGAFGGIEEAAKGFGAIIGPIFTNGVQLIKDFAADMSGAGGSFDWMGTVKSVAEGLSGVFEGFMNVLRVAVPVMGAILAVGLKLVDWVLKFVGPVLQSERAMRTLTTVFLGFAAVGVIIGVINGIRGAITGMTLALKGAELAEKSGKAATLAYNAMMSAKTVVTNIATAAQWLWNAAMAAGLLPIIAIVAGIGLLVGAFILAYKKSETFRKIVNAAINGVKKVALAVFDWFRGPFVDFWTTTLPNAFRAGLTWVQEKWAAITGFVTAPVQAAVSWFTGSFVPFFTTTIPGAFQVVLSWVKSNWPLLLGVIVGPIGLAAGLIIKNWDTVKAAVIAGFQAVVGFFTGTGSAIGSWWTANVQPIFTAIGAGFSFAGQVVATVAGDIVSVFKTIGSGIATVAQAIYGFYQTWIYPFIALFAAIVKWLWDAVVQVVTAQIQAAWDHLGQVFQRVYNALIKPVIDLFARATLALQNSVINVLQRIQAGFVWLQDRMRAVVVWIYANVYGWIGDRAVELRDRFTRIWTGVVGKFAWLRDGLYRIVAWIRTNVFGWVGDRAVELRDRLTRIWTVARDKFIWLRDVYRSIVLWIRTNVFGWIGDQATAMRDRLTRIWTTARDKFIWLRDTFRSIVSWIQLNVLLWIGDQAIAMRDRLARTWTGVYDKFIWLRDQMRAVFVWVRDNVLTAFGNAAVAMRERFRTIMDGIGRIWDRIKQLARMPIEFVVNTVMQKGIVVPFNKLAGKFPGVPTLPDVKFERGGVMPGYTPGRDIHQFWSPTGGRLALSGGEGIMVPQFVRAVGGKAGVAALNAAARAGRLAGQRFAGGGVVQPVPGRGNRHTSGYSWATWAGDFPNPIGTPIKAWKDGVVALVRQLTTSYGKHVRINHDDGSSSLYAHMSQIIARLGQQVRAGQVIGKVGSTGNSTGPHLHFETMGKPFTGAAAAESNAEQTGLISKFGDLIKGKLTQVAANFGDNALTKMAAAAPRAIMTAAISDLTSRVTAVFDKATGAITSAAAWVGSKVGAFSRDQLNNAAVIIDVARRLGFGDRGAIIGLMTALQESTLRNLKGGDRDSVGLFQQRAPWGSFADRTNPATAASMFYLGGQGGQPGLRSKAWQSMSLGQAAQAVQVSAFPGAYAKWEDEARQLLGKFKGGLAAGTRNAVRGLHLVGENGPELAWFNGGEGVLPAGITRALTSGLAGGTGAGADLVAGFVRGLLSSSQQAAEAARQVAVAAVGAIKDELGIASPSKTLAQIGVWINQGLAKGLVGSTSTVTSTIKTLTSKVTAAFQAQGQAAKNAMVDKYAAQVAKLKPLATAAASAQTKLVGVQKKLADAQKKQVSQAEIKKMEQQAVVKSSASAQVIKLSDQLTTLRRQLRDTGTAKKDQKKRSSLQAQIDNVSDSLAKARRNATGASSLLTKIEQAKKSRATVQELQSQVSSLKKLASGNTKYANQLAQAQKKLAAAKKLDPGTAAVAAGQALMKQYATLTAKINTNAAARAAVAEKIKDAQEQLTEAVKVRDDYKQAIRDQVNQAADLGSLSSATESWQITDTLQARLDSWRNFAKQLATLKGLGISTTAYQQILESGPSSGVAQALISGGKEAVEQVNFLQGEIDRVGTTLGTNASKTLYQAGVDSAKGLLNGLKAEESELNAQATRLANQMVSAMKKALKIKSPSQITGEIGTNVGLGLVEGLTSEIDDVAANGARLAEAAIQLPPANDRLADEWGRIHAAATAPAATGTTAAPQPATTIGTLNVELRLEDLKQLKTVEDFLNIIDRARVRGRTTARSGSVTTG